MNTLPCPKCGKSLFWRGARRGKFELAGKRWYQYVPPRRHCRFCGARIRFTLEVPAFWTLLTLWLGGTFIAVPMSPKYGLLATAAAEAIAAIAFSQLGRYEAAPRTRQHAKEPR